MTESFDPYYTWLGIPPDEQPPNFYRLLGVRPFEDNADVIANAADARMGFIRSFQAGPRAGLSQRLLNELSAAKVSLLDANRKAIYDRQLAQRLGLLSTPQVGPTNPLAGTPVALQPVATAPVAVPIAHVVPPVSPPIMAPPVPGAVSNSPDSFGSGNVATSRTRGVAAEPAVHRRHRKSSNSTAMMLALLGVGAAVVAVIAIVIFSMSGESEPATTPGASGKANSAAAVTNSPNKSSGATPTSSSGAGSANIVGKADADQGGKTTVPADTADVQGATGNKTVATKGPNTKTSIPPLSVTKQKSKTDKSQGTAANQRPSVLPPPAGVWSNPPQVWRYKINTGTSTTRTGAFFQTHGGWREVAKDAYFAFNRENSPKEYVQLGRTNPQVKVRLYADHAELSIGGSAFTRQYEGGWSEEPYPFTTAVRFAGQGAVRIAYPSAVFGTSSPFRAELWFRPIAAPGPGEYVLLSSGSTTLVWHVEANGRHRLGVQTASDRQLSLVVAEMRADWNHVGYAYDGEHFYLTFNGVGIRTAKQNLVSADATDMPATEIVFGGGNANAQTPAIDLAAFRLDGAGDALNEFKTPGDTVRHSLELPDEWQPNDSTVTQLSFTQTVRDRAANPGTLQLEDATVIDVLTSEPFFTDPERLADSRNASKEDLPVTNSKDEMDGSPRRLGDLLTSKPDSNAQGATPAAPETAQRLSVPEQALLTVALDRIRSMYRGQFEGAKKANEKIALATKLGEQSRKAIDAAERYVLYDQTRSLLADAAQLNDSLVWIDELAGSFDVDGLALKVAAVQRVNDVLTGASNAAPILRLQMVESAIAVSSAALELERYDEADKLAQLALQQTKSRFLNDAELRRSAKEHADSVARVRKEWQDASRAEQKLTTAPDDNLSHLILGRYRCFRGNQWQIGLPHLAKSGHARLAEAAQLDLETSARTKDAPATASDLSKTAAAWERASEGTSPDERRDCLERARYWYQAAQAAATETAELNSIRHHLDQIKSLVPTAHPRRTITMPDGTRVDVHPGLIGRVLVAGRDSGSLVTYQPGQPISWANVRRAAADVKWSGSIQIELIGFLLIADRPTFSLELEERSNQDVKQLLFLDMKQIAAIDRGRQRERKYLSLTPQRHSLVWRLDGVDSGASPTLSFPSLRDNEAPTVYYTKQMLDAFRLSPMVKGESRREFDLNAE